MGVEDFQTGYAEVGEMTLEAIIQSGRYRSSNKERVSHIEGRTWYVASKFVPSIEDGSLSLIKILSLEAGIVG